MATAGQWVPERTLSDGSVKYKWAPAAAPAPVKTAAAPAPVVATASTPARVAPVITSAATPAGQAAYEPFVGGAQPVTAAAVSNILREQQGGKAVGEWVPEQTLADGSIKYKFVGDLGLPSLADVYGITASLPDTVSSWGELADQISYLQANPQQQLTQLPSSRENAYLGSLALAMDEAGGNLSRDQMQQIANDLYTVEGNRASENYGKPIISTPIYLRPGMSAAEQYNAYLGQTASSNTPQPVAPVTYNPSPYAPTPMPPSYGGISTGGATTVGGANIMYPETSFSNPYYKAKTPAELFEMAKAQSMEMQSSPFEMPVNPALADWSQPNVPTQNPFAPRPAMFAEGGEVGQSDWQDWMSQSMAGDIPNTYQYPAYGGMPQDVFDWTAPRVSGGKLIQPPRQAPAQFEAPLLTAPVTGGGLTMPSLPGMPPSAGGTYAATPIAPVAPPSTGGISTLPGGRTPATPTTKPAPVTTTPTPVTPPPDTRSAGIQQYYRDILNREADVPGLDYWLKSGETPEQIKSNIALNERNAIEQYYRDILGREADPEGLKYWTESKDTLEQIRGNMQLIKEREAAAAAQSAAVAQAQAQAAAQAPSGGYINPEGEARTSWYAGDSGD